MLRNPFRSRFAALALVPLACAAVAACDGRGVRGGAAHPGAAPGFRAAPAAPQAAVGAGQFRVAYRPVRDTVFAQWQDDFRQEHFLEDVAAWMNDWVRLPRDVTLTFAECGESNSFYEPKDRTVTVCFELVDELDQIFAHDEDRDQAVNDALLFTTLHEVGHALVNVLDLPITGREEDAVDQLASLILVDGADDGDEAAVNGVRGLPDDDQLDDLAFADEHALNGQRFYNVLCLVYGQDPDAYAEWTRDGTLPPERAERCPEEYDRTREAWDRLLGPYLKT
ncbi:DUF4344 domain-containing metallopeptidase [Longimicrobium sp.]|uniref:DUF4344 domain-containing metallopeptidase n=1 Tax=Longimicrobium sp. TaxID=2029185 RepID=UPI002C0C1C6F|nr:DUF4344 domain-containing metallopeptidase [Longimicrobium sp.]HSU15296.1 DUF4344 domain-containing metallopeptidase [Longimicrobium sp.]